MKPSGQPRLTPNGGSSLKPAWFLFAIPGVMAIALCPPLGFLLLFALGIVILVKWCNHRDVRMREIRHETRMAEYHERRRAREFCENWTNPGWRP